jgi:ElaB/YqjD/DUF883 family membrane-anchored ribosome-binding protein
MRLISKFHKNKELFMNKVISWVKSIRLGKIITVFLSAILLFVSSACNSTGVLAKTADQVREEVPEGALTSPYKGGMNDYSDVDPRKDTSGAEAKAKELIDNAEGNIQKSANNFDQYSRNYQSGTPLGERVRRLGEDVKTSADEVTEGVAKGTQRGIENLKGNAQNAAEGTKGAAENVKENTKDAGRDFAKGTKRAADKLSGNSNPGRDLAEGTKRAADNVKENTKDAGRDLVDSAKEAASKTAGYVQDKANEAASTAQRAFDKASDAID